MSKQSLRNNLVRLANENPEMRKHLVPILASTKIAGLHPGVTYLIPDYDSSNNWDWKLTGKFHPAVFDKKIQTPMAPAASEMYQFNDPVLGARKPYSVLPEHLRLVRAVR